MYTSITLLNNFMFCTLSPRQLVYAKKVEVQGPCSRADAKIITKISLGAAAESDQNFKTILAAI